MGGGGGFCGRGLVAATNVTTTRIAHVTGVLALLALHRRHVPAVVAVLKLWREGAARLVCALDGVDDLVAQRGGRVWGCRR